MLKPTTVRETPLKKSQETATEEVVGESDARASTRVKGESFQKEERTGDPHTMLRSSKAWHVSWGFMFGRPVEVTSARPVAGE